MATNRGPAPVLWGIQFRAWDGAWWDFEPHQQTEDGRRGDLFGDAPLLRFLTQQDAQDAMEAVITAGYARRVAAHTAYKTARAEARRLHRLRTRLLMQAGLWQTDSEPVPPLRPLPAHTPRLVKEATYRRRWRVVPDGGMETVTIHLDGCDCDECYFADADWRDAGGFGPARVHIPRTQTCGDYDTCCVELALTHGLTIVDDMPLADLLAQRPYTPDQFDDGY